jgi:4-methyl-5(b-hydroxyethyl)-thiazole monophosphate biosynthesis
MKKVLIPIANGTEELEAIGIIDTLRRAGAEVTIASVQNLEITGANGIKIIADKLITDCENEKYDLIALPGGLPGARYLHDNPILTKLLKKQAEQGKLYGAICASPVVVLQKHNLLENKKATAYPAMAEQLRIQDSITENVVVDGNCITSKGPGTVLHFAMQLVESLFGKEKADEIKGQMLFQY